MTTEYGDIALEQLVARLGAVTDPDIRRWLLEELAATVDVWNVAERLKVEADRFRYADVSVSLAWSGAIEQLGILAGSDTVVALAKMTEALTVFEQDHYTESIALFDLASSLFRANRHEIGWARTQIARTSACLALSRFDEGLRRAGEARVILAAVGDSRRVAALDNNLALLLERMNRPAEAIGYSERALAFFLRGEPDYHAAHALGNHALLLWRLGKVREARTAHEHARNQYAALGAHADAAREDVNSAAVLLALGHYAQAVSLLSASRWQLQRLGSRYQASRAGMLLVECLVRLGRYGEAIKMAPDLECELTAYGAKADAIVLGVWHALACAEEISHAQAIATLNRAADLAGNDRAFAVYRAIVDHARARLLHGAGHNVEAAASLDPAIPALIEAGLNVEAATAKVLRSRVLLAAAHYDEASLAAADAASFAEHEGLDWLAAQALHARGSIESARGHDLEALATLSRAIRRLDRVQRVTAWDDRASAAAATTAVYEDATRLALRREEPETALLYVERAKARALADHLQHGIDVRPRARDAYTAGLVDELQGLRERLAWLHARRPGPGSYVLDSARGQPATGTETAAALEGQIAAIWRELQAANPIYQREAAALDVRAEDDENDRAASLRLLVPVRDALADGSSAVLLEYAALGGDLLVFVVSHNNIEVERVADGVEKARRLVTLLRLNVARSAEAIAAGAPLPDVLTRNARGVLARLYELLFRPVLRHIRGVDRLIVVPHGPAHHVPFHALHDGERYVVEEYELSYSPCADLLGHFATTRAQLRSVPTTMQRPDLVISCSHQGRLPHAEMEGRWVADILDGTLCSGEQASRGAFGELATERRIVHVAAHGNFNPDEPMFSSLHLHDGRLSTLDIFELELSASLVTLSACETALGVSRAGDELMGLSRAFLYAGASSLALTLWMVDDRSTAALMREFYRALRGNYTKAGALRQAQLAMLHNEAGEGMDAGGPFFWAPFQLIGHAGDL